MSAAEKYDVFNALAHPVRRAILLKLKQGSRPAGELAKPFEMSLAAVSQHLRVLKNAELVSEERKGRQIIYFLNSKPLRKVYLWVEEFEEFWNFKLDSLERHLDKKHK